MPVEQLLYQHDGVTYGLLVDPSMLEKFRNDEVTAASVVDVFEVFKFATGKQGDMLRPSKSECNTAFGTDDVDKVVEFILVNGNLKTNSSGKNISKKDHSATDNRKGNMEHTRAF